MRDIFNKIISFSGTIDGKTYWLIVIPMWFVCLYSLSYAKFTYQHGVLLPGLIRGFIDGKYGSEFLIPVFWISFIGLISLLVRRLRDINVSVWWALPAATHTLLLTIACVVVGLFPTRKQK